MFMLHPRRHGVVTALFDGLRPFSREPIERRLEVAAELERGCFNEAIRRCELDRNSTSWDNPYFQNMYGIFARRLLGCLLPQVEYEWRRQMVQKLLHPSTCLSTAVLLPELVPQANEMAREKLQARERAAAIERGTVKGSNMYKCPKCGARNADIGMKQTRASDEGATVIVECLECGKKFRG